MKKTSYRDMTFEQCVDALMLITRQGVLSAIKHYRYVGDETTVSKLLDARTVAQNKLQINRLRGENNEIVAKYPIISSWCYQGK